MSNFALIKRVGIFCLCFIATTAQAGRFGAPVDPNFDQTITPAISYGFVGARGAEFGGLTVNYGQAINQGWSWNIAMAWDNEKSRAKVVETTGASSKEDKRVNTFTVIGTAGFTFSPRWDISFGFGKGIVDDDNSGETLKFTNGDWSAGTSLGWTFWRKGHRQLNFSTSLEYNINQAEPSISFDLGYGFSF